MPGLHISLGIFYRLFTLLETSCHQLDLELAQHASQDTLHSYKLYSAAIHNLMRLEETLNTEHEEAEHLPSSQRNASHTNRLLQTSSILST